MEVFNLNEPEPFGPGNEKLEGITWNVLAYKCALGQNGYKSDPLLFQEISLLFRKYSIRSCLQNKATELH